MPAPFRACSGQHQTAASGSVDCIPALWWFSGTAGLSCASFKFRYRAATAKHRLLDRTSRASINSGMAFNSSLVALSTVDRDTNSY